MGKLTAKMKSALKKANSLWKKTDAAAGSGFVNDAVEDGTYDATLSGGGIMEMGGNAWAKLEYTITDGDAADEVVTSRYQLGTAMGLWFLKRDLGKFMDDPEDVENIDLENELESTIEELVEAGPEVKISVRMKDEFQNVFLNKVLSEGGDDDSEDDEEDEDEKKKPVKKPGKKPAKKDEPEDDEDDDDTEDPNEGEVEVGSKVVVLYKKDECKGVVKSIDEDEETIEVKFKHDGETVVKTFKADKVELV